VQLREPAADVILRPAAPLLEIRAGAEGPSASSGEHHRPDCGFDGSLARLLSQLGDQRAREHVHLRLAVDGQDAYRSAIFRDQVGHR